MPNTREKLDVHSKLMGLIQRAPYIGCADTDRQYAVNWLMNEGVTVQEWHSVNKCMPEDLEENKGKKVINCIVEHDPYGNGKTTAQFRQRKYDSYYKEWYWSKIGGCTVTRWTMMPQPPKGE